jgi:hypothetical protein
MIELKVIRWMGHIAHVEDERNTQKMFVSNLGLKRPLVKHKSRQQDAIVIYGKEME